MEFLEVFYTQFVPFFLFTVMVAMGLSLTVRDLVDVIRRPKALITGLSAQLLFLPPLAIGFGFLFDSPPVIAAGAIILAACPGGITSNAYVFAARADIALSIGLTAVASFITVFTVPLLTLLALNLHLDRSEVPTLPTGEMMWTLAQLTIVPVALGMTVRHYRPGAARRMIEPLRIITLVALIIIVVIGVVSAWDTIVENALTAGVLMTAINVTAMSVGYALGRIMQLPFPQVASITFEVGVQNLSMALFVTFTFLKSPELAIATIVYAFIMKITAMFLVVYVRRRLGTPAAATA
ncbi:MAG: bile acid:sodium symporter family protein [Gammaproteobacteria bacterium]|nr:bile acid:sodium symporter family protein [Gammaproteobacteria bacterium]